MVKRDEYTCLVFTSSPVQLSAFSHAGIEAQRNYLPNFTLVVSGRGKIKPKCLLSIHLGHCFSPSVRCHGADAGKERYENKESRHDLNWTRDAGCPGKYPPECSGNLKGC